MKQPPNGFRRKNHCPYCGYTCDAALDPKDEKAVPQVGDLSFCLMCCEASQFDRKMRLTKFDIDGVRDIKERDRLKGIQLSMRVFWEQNPQMIGRRKKAWKH